MGGPAYLILDNVPPGATLTNRAGYTDCGSPAGHAPFMRIKLGPSPSPADYDGDGRVDPSVYVLNAQWSTLILSLSTSPGQFGFKTVQVVQWPELGQGKAVFAIYNWY